MTPSARAQLIIDADACLKQGHIAHQTMSGALKRFADIAQLGSQATPQEIEEARVNYIAAAEAWADLRVKFLMLARRAHAV